MTNLATVGTEFNAGDLDGAIAAATAQVKAHPSDPAPRLLLAELLLFEGNFERAETLLAALGTISPDLALIVAEFRQLLRAEQLRRQVLTEGAVPNFLGEPTEAQRAALASLVALRNGDTATAAIAAEAQELARPRVAGTHHLGNTATPFDDFRDTDDVLAGSLELLTTTGTLYWVSLERIISLELAPPRRPRDLFWRRASIVVQAGPEGDVYLPVTYPGLPGDAAALRLGRETDWTDTAPVRGRGQRLFLAGDTPLAINEIERIEFDPAGESDLAG